jgi:hypothetical protein
MFFFPDLFHCLEDVGLDFVRVMAGGLFLYFLDDAVKSELPVIDMDNPYLYPLMLFNCDLLDRFENAIFEDGMDYLGHCLFTSIMRRNAFPYVAEV